MNPHTPARRATGLSNRLLGSTSTERFHRYTRASTALVLLICPMLPLSGLAQVARATPDPLLLAIGALVVVGAVVAVAWLGPALDVFLGRAVPTRLQWLSLSVPVVVTLLVASLFVPIVPQVSWGTPHAIAVSSVIAPACVLACLLDRRQTIVLLCGLIGLPLLIVLLRGLDPFTALVLALVPSIVIGSLVYTCRLSGWMLGVVAELEAARATAARLAVAEERLRFSRDLHDVVGRSLSAVALKSQLAAELVRRDRTDRAVAEMESVHTVASEALEEMRAVVAGYRRAELATELAGARAILGTSGVSTRVSGESVVATIDAPHQEALGWALREAVTNVVRHSEATWCTIALETGDRVRLTVTNDGARRTRHGAGSGLVGLAERITPLGGTIETASDGSQFVVTFTLPLAAAPEGER